MRLFFLISVFFTKYRWSNFIKIQNVSKNTLSINLPGNGKFTPKFYRLYNVLKSGVLVLNVNISTANGSDDSYTTGNVISFEVDISNIYKLVV